MVSIDRYCFSIGALDIIFLILKGHHLVFCIKRFAATQPLEHILLVMWKRIGEALKMVYSAYQFAETWYYRQ